MIDFFFETEFDLHKKEELKEWITEVINSEDKTLGEISYVFCSDHYLHSINLKFLDHDTFTDIISFDNSLGNEMNGEIYISVDRVKENAEELGEKLDDELHRVMIHGILHFCGHKDASENDKMNMRKREDQALSRRQFI